MLVAVSGSQGSGKTVIIDLVEQEGFQTVKRKTSRSIMAEWGVTLSEVNNNADLTIRFQEEILKRKIQDDIEAAFKLPADQCLFTERSFTDLFTFACVSLGKDNQYSEWLNSYYKKCLEAQQEISLLFYLPAGHFVVQHDGVRGSNPHYSCMVDVTMLEFTKQMTHPSVLNVIQTPVLEERKSIIIQQTRHFLKQ